MNSDPNRNLNDQSQFITDVIISTADKKEKLELTYFSWKEI